MLPMSRDALLAHAEELVSVYPNRAAGWYLASLHYRGKSARIRRLSALKKAIELQPNHANALNEIAWEMVTHREDSRVAHQYAERAVMVAPWNAEIVDTLAATLAAQNRCAEARAVQLRAVELLHERAAKEYRDKFVQRAEGYIADCSAKLPGPDEE